MSRSFKQHRFKPHRVQILKIIELYLKKTEVKKREEVKQNDLAEGSVGSLEQLNEANNEGQKVVKIKTNGNPCQVIAVQHPAMHYRPYDKISR